MPKRAAKKKVTKPRVARTRCGGRWTEAQYKGFVVRALRAAMRKWRVLYDTKDAAKRGQRTDQATGKKRDMYECAGCARLFKSDEIHVDHIEPVFDPRKRVPAEETDYTQLVHRMFCEIENLQILCHTCHGIKTENERKQRYGKED
jgi:5-methylcytosine-specific restriction endonuclease McrA